MRFPATGKKARYRMTVPTLSGGVNLHDAPQLVEDNQLTDCQNMWWKDGALRTRPGLHTTVAAMQALTATQTLRLSAQDTYLSQQQTYGKYALLQQKAMSGGTYTVTNTLCTIGYDGSRSVCTTTQASSTSADSGYDSVMLVEGAPADTQTAGQLLFQGDGSIFASPADGSTAADQTAKIYAPLVLVNGRGNAASDGVTGTQLEGYNMLTGAFRAWYTTDGMSTFFSLPQKELDDISGHDIVAEYTDSTGAVKTWTIASPSGVSASAQTIGADSVKALVNRTNGAVAFLKEGSGETSEPYALPVSGITNNLRVKAWKTDSDAKKIICRMRFAAWFGGDRSGLNGGTRLFVSGNPAYPNLVRWSDINQPLYFPENNYAYVGDSGQAVTAFAKQADMLVIFKEREMYYTTYVAGDAYTAQDIIEGKIVDVTAHAATFPIIQLHATIGCDCPDTVQLCNNRLVWASAEGMVYTISATSPYNERSVCLLSGPVASALREVAGDTLRTATSGEYGGYYVLLAGSRLFLMDENAAGFNSPLSTANEGIGKAIPWYLWKLPDTAITWQGFMARGEQAVLLAAVTLNGALYHVVYVLKGTTDFLPEYSNGIQLAEQAVICRFCTKAFDFGRAEQRKSVEQLYLGTGDAQSTIRLTYQTDRGTQQDAAVYTGGGVCRKTPNAVRVRRFALQADCEGVMAVESMILKFKWMGVGR